MSSFLEVRASSHNQLTEAVDSIFGAFADTMNLLLEAEGPISEDASSQEFLAEFMGDYGPVMEAAEVGDFEPMIKKLAAWDEKAKAMVTNYKAIRDDTKMFALLAVGTALTGPLVGLVVAANGAAKMDLKLVAVGLLMTVFYRMSFVVTTLLAGIGATNTALNLKKISSARAKLEAHGAAIEATGNEELIAKYRETLAAFSTN